jgi:AcrR family transcriptional regulator
MVRSLATARGSQERRTRERAETRQRILEAAREMFVHQGYEATTMRAIAEKIEYTPTAIYHHFRNKEALLTELSHTDFLALATAFQRIGRIEDPIERLRRLGSAYVEFGLEHPMQYQLMFMTLHPQIAKKDRGEDPGENAYAFLRQTCEQAIASRRLRPEYRDPDELSQIMWASLHGLIALHIVKRDDTTIRWFDPRSTAERMSAATIRGVLRRE